MRTQDEIVARLAAVADEDLLGFAREVLLGQLDWAHIQPFLRDDHGLDGEEFERDRRANDLTLDANGYLSFAIGKIVDHRGISASRSVDKLREFAWLLGRDDVVAAMDAADYPQYGAPKVYAYCVGMGWPEAWPTDNAGLARMLEGQPCSDDCLNGCGAL